MSRPPERSTVNILLAEDGSDDVELVRRAFAKVWSDCRLHVVENGEQARAFLNRSGDFATAPVPDLILLDLNMPSKNGYDVLLEVKQDEALRLIPVVVLTTSSDRDSIMQTYKLHADSFVTKPVGAEQLERIVQLVIEYWFSAVGLAKDG